MAQPSPDIAAGSQTDPPEPEDLGEQVESLLQEMERTIEDLKPQIEAAAAAKAVDFSPPPPAELGDAALGDDGGIAPPTTNTTSDTTSNTTSNIDAIDDSVNVQALEATAPPAPAPQTVVSVVATEPPVANAPLPTVAPPSVESAKSDPASQDIDPDLGQAIDAALKEAAAAASHETSPAPQPAAHTAEPLTPSPAPTTGAAEMAALDEKLADTASDLLDETDPAAVARLAPASQATLPTTPALTTVPAAPLPERQPDAVQPTAAPAPTPANQSSAPAGASAPAPNAPPADAAKPSPKSPTPAPNAANPNIDSPAAPQVVVVPGAAAPAGMRPLAFAAKSGAMVLLAINSPLALLPPSMRDLVGYAALVTLFNAAAVWFFTLLRH